MSHRIVRVVSNGKHYTLPSSSKSRAANSRLRGLSAEGICALQQQKHEQSRAHAGGVQGGAVAETFLCSI